MSELLKRIERYSDDGVLFELDDFTDVADVMRHAQERIAGLEQKNEALIAALADIAFQAAAADMTLDVARKKAKRIYLTARQEIENE